MPYQTALRRTLGIISISTVVFTSHAQVASPGPFEILPFDEAYIVEAFCDLLPTPDTNRADWTGWFGTTWESPNAYNNHEGTDFSAGTGTPVYAATTGTVIALETTVPENTFPSGKELGNYVKIQASALSPFGEQATVLVAHLLPTVQVTVGQSVSVGQLIGYSDNTGNSTSEHCHVQAELTTGGVRCPFYHALYKYPIMLNPNARVQVGHVVRVKATSTPIRSDRFDSSSIITTAHQNQLYFASFDKRGYWRIFIPNDATNRSGWIKAIDVEDVLTGTVIQPLPDVGAYVHTTQLAGTYPIYATSNTGSSVIGQVRFAGGRFVADQTAPGDWYRIPVPGASATWGWVQANSRMVVYPQLINPTINLAQGPQKDFPFNNALSTLGTLNYGRPKFDRGSVSFWDAPGTTDDGNAFFLTDATNAGDGAYETRIFGRPDQRNYYVQAQVYFNYQPAYIGSSFERYGIFLRDDGFGGWDQTFEGRGNCYAFTWDNDDGRLRCARIMDATVTDLLPSVTSVTTPGWHTMRMEAQENVIRYYLDGTLRHTATDSTFPSGLFGLGYSWRPGGYPAARGAYFRNFQADSIPGSAISDWALY